LVLIFAEDISQIDGSSTDLFTLVLSATSLSSQIAAIKELFKEPDPAKHQEKKILTYSIVCDIC
jgi:hypothetical protein